MDGGRAGAPPHPLPLRRRASRRDCERRHLPQGGGGRSGRAHCRDGFHPVDGHRQHARALPTRAGARACNRRRPGGVQPRARRREGRLLHSAPACGLQREGGLRHPRPHRRPRADGDALRQPHGGRARAHPQRAARGSQLHGHARARAAGILASGALPLREERRCQVGTAADRRSVELPRRLAERIERAAHAGGGQGRRGRGGRAEKHLPPHARASAERHLGLPGTPLGAERCLGLRALGRALRQLAHRPQLAQQRGARGR
mmetsp:Transcript_15492/g.36791  ORF Transcript_15492/g.36791 Transcript_15492/m.36791 type:complete len:261 (+) Transcript_15492:419-1201(+)